MAFTTLAQNVTSDDLQKTYFHVNSWQSSTGGTAGSILFSWITVGY